jgi:hypothetical protein
MMRKLGLRLGAQGARRKTGRVISNFTPNVLTGYRVAVAAGWRLA